MLNVQLKPETCRVPKEIEKGMHFYRKGALGDCVYVVTVDSENHHYALRNIHTGDLRSTPVSREYFRRELINGDFYHIRNIEITVSGDIG